MDKKTVKDIDLKGKRVLMRVDFNVPMDKGVVTDDKRIKAALPTIKYVLEQGASLILMSHLGRPKGGPDPEFSLKPAAQALSSLLGIPVKMAPDCVGPEVEAMAKALKPGEVLMLENTRFHAGEEKNDLGLAKQMAAPGRCLRQRCLRVGPPGPLLHRGRGPLPAGRLGLPDGTGAGVPRAGYQQPRAPLHCHPGRGQDQRQDPGGGEPADQMRQAHHRRRHGEYFPGCQRLEYAGQPGGEGSPRYRQKHPGQIQRPDRFAGGRGHCG